MKWNLILAAFLFVVLGVPLIILNLGALGMQARVEKAVLGETVVPGAIADAGDEVLDVWGDFREDREIDALFVEDRFTRRRSVTYSETVTLDDLLADGETPPDAAFEELWVLARASQRALEKECPVVLDTIGRACAVSSATADARDDGRWRIKAVVGYLPDEPLGDIAVDGRQALYRNGLRVPPGRGSLRLAPEAREAAKRSLYGEVARACDEMRAAQGNCVIGGLEFRESRPGADGLVSYSATASLYTVGPAGLAEAGLSHVRTYEKELAAGDKSSVFAALIEMFGTGDAKSVGVAMSGGDGPVILRGGHQRYGGNDGRFTPAPDP